MDKKSDHDSAAGLNKNGLCIDSHIHLWDLSVYKRRDWLEDKPALIRDFLPSDAEREFDRCGVSHGIVVEAVKYSVEDNVEWLRMAAESRRLLGAVTGCYLQDPRLPDILARYAEWDSFVGVRATPKRESNQWDDLGSIERGLELLCDRSVTLEILAEPADLPHLTAIAARYPDLVMVVDHCGLPNQVALASGEWRAGVERLVEHERVFMKYSGFAMLGKGLENSGFFGTIADTLIEVLGPSRLIWGSNWPVDSLWVPYRTEWDLARDLLPEDLSSQAIEQIYAGNALRAFRIGE